MVYYPEKLYNSTDPGILSVDFLGRQFWNLMCWVMIMKCYVLALPINGPGERVKSMLIELLNSAYADLSSWCSVSSVFISSHQTFPYPIGIAKPTLFAWELQCTQRTANKGVPKH